MNWTWIALTIVYLNIGYFIGLMSWRAWNEKNKKETRWFTVLFPISQVLGLKDIQSGLIMYMENDKILYATLLSLVWPIKALVNAVFGLIVLFVFLIMRIHKTLFLPANSLERKIV